MKKTLIALLALGSVAMATTRTADITAMTVADFNDTWATTLDTVEWAEGADFTLTLTLTGGFGNGAFMKLADNHFLVSQATGGPYFGMNTAQSNSLASGWQGTFDFSKDGDAYTMTEKDGQTLATWSLNAAGTGSASRTLGDALTLTIDSSKAAGTTVQYSYAGTTIVDTFVMPQTTLNLADVKMLGSVALNGAGHLSVTPEPATATLSLLALAGLAARRRRH